MVFLTLIRYTASRRGTKTPSGYNYIRILEYEPKKRYPSFANRFQATPTSKPVTHLKICTMDDMRQLLQPKLCNCPNVSCNSVPIHEYVSMVVRWVIFAAIVKYTADLGFWSPHNVSIPLYNKIVDYLSKEVFNVKRPDPRTPLEKYEMATQTYNLAETYNAFVRNTLGAVFATPGLLYDGAMMAYDYVYGQVESSGHEASKEGEKLTEKCKS